MSDTTAGTAGAAGAVAMAGSPVRILIAEGLRHLGEYWAGLASLPEAPAR